ncbi:probable transcriptional regulator SLK2 [Rutidosis leptorrhynchoides]|uniref:probable transcriptional regulator SLK2 n=1 Tax=Rutidosis leptorrhynchoides TaxID=125765 RepID=UPI003A9905F3
MGSSRLNGRMPQSPSSSGIFFEGDEQSHALRSSYLSSYGNMYSNMVPVSGGAANGNSGPGSSVTDANSGLSGGNPSLKRSASINAESYARLPASPLSFNSNNFSISGSSVLDGSSPVQQGLQQGASTATSVPNPRNGQGLMFNGSFNPDRDNLMQKRPRLDLRPEDILQQQTIRQLLQRQDPMQLQNPNNQLQLLYHQQQLLQSLSPMQRAQLVQQQQQQVNSRQVFPQQSLQPATPVNRSIDNTVCSRRLMQYLFHQRHRPADINFWKKFVAEYYSPRAKQRWCFSVHNNVGHHQSGVFSPENTDVWHCSICRSKSGRGFEAAFEILPRLNDIKFGCGVIDELWFLDSPRECRFSSGIMMLEYGKAIQESVYEQLRVVHEGRLKVIFTPDLKILSWEFCSWRHEELLPRRLLASQVNKMLEVAQKCQSAIAESGSGGVSQQDLQTSSNMLVTAGRQLARSLESQSLNDLGFTKRHVRCLQIAEVVSSMKDLMDVTKGTNVGPIEALKRFTRDTSVAKLQMQKMQQGIQPTLSGIQSIPNDRNALGGLVAIQPGVNSSMNNNFQAGSSSQGAPILSNYQNTFMKQNMINLDSQVNRSQYQGLPLQNNNGKIPSGIFQVQQSQNQNQMIQQVMKGTSDDNNNGSGAKPSSSGQSGCGLTRSNSFKAGGSGSHSDSCAGGEKAPDLPHVSDVFQDIISEFTENGFFNNDELAGKHDW